MAQEGTRVKALENGLRVLMAIPPNKSISITALSRELGISKGSICKILATFRDFNFVKQDPVTNGYSLGPMLIAKGYQALASLDIRRLAKPELQHLTDTYNENSMLMIEQSEQVVVIELCEANASIRSSLRLGECYPFYRGAGPKVLLAFMNETKRNAIIEKTVFEQLTENTLTTPDMLKERLEKIKTDGYCISPGEIDSHGYAIAVPVFGTDQKIIASVAISGPKWRMENEDTQAIISDLKNCARNISIQLGVTF